MGTKWALWAGNTNGNGAVEFAFDPSDITPISNAIVNASGNPTHDPTWFGAAAYDNADTDMNGFVQFAFDPSDITPISASVLGNPANTASDPTLPLSQQLP